MKKEKQKKNTKKKSTHRVNNSEYTKSLFSM